MQVVDDAEKRSWEARKRCLILMQTHIEEQLKVLQERADKWQKKLARIKKRERVGIALLVVHIPGWYNNT